MDKKEKLTNKQFENERIYREALEYVDFLLMKGLITDKQYEKINKALIKKFKPFIGGI